MRDRNKVLTELLKGAIDVHDGSNWNEILRTFENGMSKQGYWIVRYGNEID